VFSKIHISKYKKAGLNHS